MANSVTINRIVLSIRHHEDTTYTEIIKQGALPFWKEALWDFQNHGRLTPKSIIWLRDEASKRHSLDRIDSVTQRQGRNDFFFKALELEEDILLVEQTIE